MERFSPPGRNILEIKAPFRPAHWHGKTSRVHLERKGNAHKMWERKDPSEDWKREFVTVSRRQPEGCYCGGEEQREGGKGAAPGPGAAGAHTWKTAKNRDQRLKAVAQIQKSKVFHQSALTLPLNTADGR